MNLQATRANPLEGLTRRFSNNAATLKYDDIPEQVRQKAKDIIRDGVANQIAASGISEAAIAMVKLAKEWGGAPQSTVSGFGYRLPAPVAAMCNGMMGHGVELDDAHGSGLIKAGSVMIPALFAAAELNPEASGKDAIVSLVAGYELAIRVAKSINPGHRQRGYHTTSTVALLGAALITARMLRCSEDQIADAIGLAAMQSSGIQAYLDDPCMAKPFGPGKGAFNGVLAGVLASRGFTGPKKVLESKEGFLNAFTDSVRIEDLTDGFGEEFAIMEVGFKPHAACRYGHGPIDIAQRMHSEGIRISNVSGITVMMSKLAIRQASKYPCPSLNAAMGSTQFGVALALDRGSNGLKDYWDGYESKDIHQAASMVNLQEEPEFGVGGRQSIISVELKDGRKVSYRQEEPKGEPSHPMSREELDRKFFSTAGLILDERRVGEISERMMHLDDERQAGSLPPLTVAPDSNPKLRAA